MKTNDFYSKLKNLSEEERGYLIRQLPKHLLDGGEFARLNIVLTDIFFVKTKIEENLIFDLIDDFNRATDIMGDSKQDSPEILSLKRQLREMPPGWKPIREKEDKIEIAFWDQEEFLAYTQYKSFFELFDPSFKKSSNKNIVWITPSYSKICYLLAFNAIERNELDKALYFLDIGLKIEPDHPLLLCEKGIALRNKSEESLKLYEKAFKSRSWTPKRIRAKALRGMGIELIELKSLEKAEYVFLESLKLAPNNKIAISELRYIDYLKKGGTPSTIMHPSDKSSTKSEISQWSKFIKENSHILQENPFLISQLISNTPKSSTIFKKSKKLKYDGLNYWVKWINKPTFELHGNSANITIKGHEGVIHSIDFSSDGSLVYTGGSDNLIKIWDYKTGKCKRTLVGHKERVRSLALTPDNEKLISGDDSGYLFIWDTKTGKLITSTNNLHKKRISTIICINNNHICSGGGDQEIVFWKLEEFKLIKKSNRLGSEILKMELSSNKKFIVITTQDGPIFSYSTQQYILKNIGNVNPGLGKGIALFGHDKKAAVASAMNTELIDIVNNSKIQTLKNHTGSILDMDITSDEKYLISGGVDRILQISELPTGKIVSSLKEHNNAISSLKIAPNNKSFISGDQSGYLKIWEPIIQDNTQTIGDPHSSRGQRITSLELTIDKKNVLFTLGESHGNLYEGLLSEDILRPKNICSGDFLSVNRANNTILTVSSNDAILRTIDASNYAITKEFVIDKSIKSEDSFSLDGDHIHAVCYSEDYKKCIFCTESTIRIFDIALGSTIKKINYEIGLGKIAFDSRTNIIYSCGLKMTLDLIDIEKGIVLKSIDIKNERKGFAFGNALAFDISNRSLSIGTLDGDILIFNLDTYKLVNSNFNGKKFTSIDIKNGLIVSGTFYGQVYFIDSISCKELASFYLKGEPIVTSCSIVDESKALIGTMTGEIYYLEIKKGKKEI